MRYQIKPSSTPDWWVATDTENLVVVRFERGYFNETQIVTLLDESLIKPMALPRILREMGDWLATHHADKLFR